MKIKKNYYQWMQYWTMLYCASMFLGFPLVFQNNYINMLETKTTFFKISTVIYLIGGIIVIWLMSVFEAEDKRKNRYQIEHQQNFKLGHHDKWMLFFAGSVILSTILSGDISNAWYSPNGKQFGTMVLLLCCGMYFLIAKDGLRLNILVKGSLVIGTATVFVLAILNRYQIDPLQMYSNLVPEQKHLYISTIGNVNILSGFLCVFVPLFAGAFLYTKEITDKYIYGCMYLFGIMAGICTNSDSFFLGIGAALFCLLWLSMENKSQMLDFISLSILGILGLLCLRFLEKIMPEQAIWESLQEELIHEVSWGVIFVLMIAVRYIIKYWKKEIPFIKIRKWMFIFIGICFLLFCIYVIILNVGDVDTENSILIFNDKWGTNRGFVWKRTWQIFEELPFYKKMTGIGPGAFKEYFSIYNEERLRNSLAPFADPHSEYLFYLISTGILGLVTYLGTFIIAIRNCIRKKNAVCSVLLVIICSWLAQGMVNNPIVFTSPFVFMVLGISSYEEKYYKVK